MQCSAHCEVILLCVIVECKHIYFKMTLNIEPLTARENSRSGVKAVKEANNELVLTFSLTAFLESPPVHVIRVYISRVGHRTYLEAASAQFRDSLRVKCVEKSAAVCVFNILTNDHVQFQLLEAVQSVHRAVQSNNCGDQEQSPPIPPYPDVNSLRLDEGKKR